MAYAYDQSEIFRYAAHQIKTAEQIGITLPPSIIVQADAVIE
jgi:hypothetical protein